MLRDAGLTCGDAGLTCSDAQPDVMTSQKVFEEAVVGGDVNSLMDVLHVHERKALTCSYRRRALNVNILHPRTGQTPLHQGVIDGNLELVKLLVSLGADPGITNREGWLPLHLSCWYGHLEVTECLLRGASPPPPPGHTTCGVRDSTTLGGYTLPPTPPASPGPPPHHTTPPPPHTTLTALTPPPPSTTPPPADIKTEIKSEPMDDDS